MPFQLLLFLSYPRDVFQVEAPLPLTPSDGVQVDVRLGKVCFYFDIYDTPPDNISLGRPSRIEAFYVHFIASEVPSVVDGIFDEDHPFACALGDYVPAALEPLRRMIWPEKPWRLAERTPERLQAEVEYEKLNREWSEHVERTLDEMLEHPIVGGYLKELGKTLRDTMLNFLKILKVEYGQYLVPDSLPFLTARNTWVLPDGRESSVNDQFLDRLLQLRNWVNPGDISKPVAQGAWSVIGRQIEAGYNPPFSEVLFASALGQCDPDLGNPRLALIEAVTGLEVEIKKLMSLRLALYGLSKSAVDRLVRETPLADLATGWIRRELGDKGDAITDDDYQRCAEAIHERNELIHHERRRVARERVVDHIAALAKMARLARRARESG